MSKLCIITLASLALTSCVTHEATQINAAKSPESRIGSAVVSPLGDLNIMQIAIPAVLSEAVKNPYKMPSSNTCQELTEQVQLLDAALGPDFDAKSAEGGQTFMDQGQEFAQNEAIGSVERTIQGVVPFRSWIRKISGAEKRSKELSTAVAAGVVRRAFLKGMGEERSCAPPAAPIKFPMTPTSNPVTSVPQP